MHEERPNTNIKIALSIPNLLLDRLFFTEAWLATKSSHSPASAPNSAFKFAATSTSFYMGTGDLDSGPHDCTAGTH